MNHALLNALVAERVMGWKWIEFDSKDYDGINFHIRVIVPKEYMQDDVLRHLPNRGGVSEHFLLNARFDPSRNIAHAHEMRDKVLRENPWCVESECWTIGGKQWFRVCITHRSTDEMICASLEADSECIAICLAALRAVGVTDKEIEEVANG